MNINNLKPNPENPRTISKEDFEKLLNKIKRNPDGLDANKIVYKDGIVIAGNQRLRALKQLAKEGLEIKDDWFKDVSGWTDEQIREYLVISNISDGDWDVDKLANQYESAELIEWGLDLPGFEDPSDVQEDEPPEVSSDPPISKLGEVYQLGKHRLMCGDSTKIEDVEKLMGGGMADLFLTDPPYNVEYVGKTKDALTIKNDKMEDNNFLQFLVDAFSSASAFMKSGASFYIWHADSEGYNFRGACKQSGLSVRQCLVWNKNSMVMGRQDYQWKHEPCLYGWKEGGSHKWYADRKQTTVIDFQRPSRSEEHPTMKPVGLMAYSINNSSKSGDIVLDTFGGSGSTLIACEQTNRSCYMMELDEKYCDVIRKRYHILITGSEDGWELLTGKIQGE